MIDDQSLSTEPQADAVGDDIACNQAPDSPCDLRHRDQAVVAAFAVAALLALGIWYLGNMLSDAPEIHFEATKHQTAHFLVDINKATWPEIAQLPGVGETLARRVVESREHDGPFRDLTELRRVRGVGKVTFERIAPYLTPIVAGDHNQANIREQ